jgi:hypothetical protein
MPKSYLAGGPFDDTIREIPIEEPTWKIPVAPVGNFGELTAQEVVDLYSDPWNRKTPTHNYAIYVWVGTVEIIRPTGCGRYQKYLYAGLEER